MEKVYLIHNIGESPSQEGRIKSNYNTRNEVVSAEGLLTIDGVYLNVWENRDILKGRECLLFVMGDYIGEDNSFDEGMPLERFCNMKQLGDLVGEGHTIGWHTWSHPDLTTVSLEEARKEMKCPWDGVKDFAFPYGEYNKDLMELAKELGYERAWSVTQGTVDTYSLFRDYL